MKPEKPHIFYKAGWWQVRYINPLGLKLHLNGLHRETAFAYAREFWKLECELAH